MRRIFIGVPVPEDVRSLIAQVLDDHIAGPLPGSIVPPENWHVTLRFLGETDEPTYDRLLHALSEADMGRRFRVVWGELGAFPRPGRANVLWLGPVGDDGFSGVAAVVEDAVVGAGLPPEERPFHPHLTLSRLRPAQSVAGLVAAVPALGVPMEVSACALYQSRLGRGGAEYSVLERFPLDG